MITRQFSPVMLEALTGTPQRALAFVEMDWPNGWVRVHSGVGERIYNGETYLGIGELGSIGNIKEDGNSSANRLKLTLSILDQSLLADIFNNDPNGRDCFIHLVAFDENRQILEGYDYFYDGEMVDVDIKRGKPAKGLPARITVTCSDWYERWSTAPESARTTDAAQQHLYPGDKFFDQIEVIAGSPLHSLPFKTNDYRSRPNRPGDRER